jgi:hypothetical protein
MVIGSGVYRIGSSVEFDWCAVRSIQVNVESVLRTQIYVDMATILKRTRESLVSGFRVSCERDTGIEVSPLF